MQFNIDIKQSLISEFKNLINVELPVKYQFPVKFNHCFNRIILDWLFNDCWYNHLDKNKTAISQLNNNQLQKAIWRMNAWLRDQDFLITDNNSSLQYRKKVLHQTNNLFNQGANLNALL